MTQLEKRTTKKGKKKDCVLSNYYDLTSIISMALQKQMGNQKCFHKVTFSPIKKGVKVVID